MKFLVASKEERRFLYDSCLEAKGFNAKQRRDAWLLSTGALQKMVTSPPKYYRKLVDYAKHLYESYPSNNPAQIVLDLPRTFADEVSFASSTNVGQKMTGAIERVCLAYSVRNGVIGYC